LSYCGDVNEHEVYPDAPVVLVTLEVRHPHADALTDKQADAIRDQLVDRVPIARPRTDTNIEIGPATGPVGRTENVYRYTNRAQTTAVTIRRNSFTVETTAYLGWPEFRTLVQETVAVRMAVAPIAGIERVGLRYIDELRVPVNQAADVDWSQWVHPSLLGPHSADPNLPPPADWGGYGLYGSPPAPALVLHYGPATGYAVDPHGELKRKASEGGPFFLMDIDSFWTPGDYIPECAADTLIDICDDLHRPVRTLFEGFITDRLRNEVLRNNE
jgi:uncharacterized protein (TIGR04255 family)